MDALKIAEMSEYVNLIHLKDGDVLFVDADAIDVREFTKNIYRGEGMYLPRVLVVPVLVPPKKTIHDVVLGVTKDTVDAIVKARQEQEGENGEQ